MSTLERIEFIGVDGSRLLIDNAQRCADLVELTPAIFALAATLTAPGMDWRGFAATLLHKSPDAKLYLTPPCDRFPEGYFWTSFTLPGAGVRLFSPVPGLSDELPDLGRLVAVFVYNRGLYTSALWTFSGMNADVHDRDALQALTAAGWTFSHYF